MADQDLSAFARVDASAWRSATGSTSRTKKGLSCASTAATTGTTPQHTWSTSTWPNASAASGTAAVFHDFHHNLMELTKHTPYPQAELERIRARAGQHEGLTTGIA
jgi:hypothetical protein